MTSIARCIRTVCTRAPTDWPKDASERKRVSIDATCCEKFALRSVQWHHACGGGSWTTREASRGEGGASMDLNEKVLYHQIHPAKLAADVSGSILSTYLMWRRRFAWALLAAFVPAVLASVLVIRYANLERRKHSRFGRYMQRYMDRRLLDAWRFFGQVLMWVGAWYRVGKLVPIGVATVVAAWVSGLWRKPAK